MLTMDEEKREQLIITVGNLSKYVQGTPVEKTLGLPANPEDVNRLLKDIGISDKSGESFLPDYQIPENVSYLKEIVHEYTNPMELNMVMHLIRKVEPDEEVMTLLLQEHYQDLTMIEFGNLVLQSEKLPYIRYEFEGRENLEYISPEEKYGYTITTGNGTYEELKGLGVVNYVDFEAIGRDTSIKNLVRLGEYGYITDTGKSHIRLDKYSKEELYKVAGLEVGELTKKVESAIKEVTPKL